LDEKAVDACNGGVLVEADRRYIRPLGTGFLLGKARKAREKLGCRPKMRFEELVRITVEADMKGERMLLEETKVRDETWRTHI